MTVQISLKRNNRVFHTVSKAMWQLNATFANSQSCRKREILSPGPYNPMTWNASSHTLPSREPLFEETLSSSDQASPSLSHIGLWFGQPIFHFVSQTRDMTSISVSFSFRNYVQGDNRALLEDISSREEGSTDVIIEERAEGLTARLRCGNAAVICDADDPCSVKTACDPESSLTMSPRSTSLPLYFWHWGSSSEFLRWQRSIKDAKWTFLLSFLASITSFFVSDFRQRYLFLFVLSPSFLFFSTASFASGMFNAWGIGIKLCIK